MKTSKFTSLCSLILASSLLASHAWVKVGNVYCDSNTNGLIDAGDMPVQSVLVIVTNQSGTFSNASWTTAAGLFVMNLPDAPDQFIDYIHPDTLPLGTTHVLPPFSLFSTTTNQTTVTNNFLIQNPACICNNTNPPPPTNSGCWLTGGGTISIGSGRGQPTYSYGGVVNPGCSPTAAGGGNWNLVAHTAKLHFKGLEIQVLNCGNVPGYPPGSSSPRSPNNFIEFQGVGTLKGISGNKANHGIVYFFGHAEDLGEPGKGVDRLYLRVYDSAGNTLLLISGDAAHPLNVSPVTVSTGNLQIHPCKSRGN